MNKLIPLIGVQCLAAAVAIVDAVSTQSSALSSFNFDPIFVYPVLNTIFLLPAALGVGYTSARAFNSSGLIGLQLMGLGAMALLLSSLSAWAGVGSGALVARPQDVSFYYSIQVLFGGFTGGILQLAGAVLAFRESKVKPELRRIAMLGSYSTVILVGVAITAAAGRGLTDSIFSSSPQTGSLGTAVIAAAGLTYAITTAFFGWLYLNSRSDILYWNMIALLLVTMSSVIVFLSQTPGDIFSWIYRGVTIVYAGAFFNAVLSSRTHHEGRTLETNENMWALEPTA